MCVTWNYIADVCCCVIVVNLGGLLLQALLEYWPRTHSSPMDEETELNHGKKFNEYVLCSLSLDYFLVEYHIQSICLLL